jgi:hypothetical protein
MKLIIFSTGLTSIIILHAGFAQMITLVVSLFIRRKLDISTLPSDIFDLSVSQLYSMSMCDTILRTLSCVLMPFPPVHQRYHYIYSKSANCWGAVKGVQSATNASENTLMKLASVQSVLLHRNRDLAVVLLCPSL